MHVVHTSLTYCSTPSSPLLPSRLHEQASKLIELHLHTHQRAPPPLTTRHDSHDLHLASATICSMSEVQIWRLMKRSGKSREAHVVRPLLSPCWRGIEFDGLAVSFSIRSEDGGEMNRTILECDIMLR
jgi:hypothetical protein